VREKSIRDLRFYSHGLGQFAEEMLEIDLVNAEFGRFVSMLQSVFMAELLKCYLIICSHDNNSSQLFKSLRLAIVQTLFLCVQGKSRMLGTALVCFGTQQWRRQGLVVKCVLNKSSGKAGANGGSVDPARVALERLFEQAHLYEARMSDPMYSQESGLEHVVNELEVDLDAALNALREKEEELQVAEQTVKADQWEVQIARSALQQREEELEAASRSHSGKRDELKCVNQQLVLKGEELQSVLKIVKEKEIELYHAQEALGRKQEELNRSRNSLLEKDDVLANTASKLKLKDLELQQANELLSKQLIDLEFLRASLLAKENELQRSDKEKCWRQEKLEKTEAELEKRMEACLAAEEDLKTLEHDVMSCRERGKVTATELSQVKILLSGVQMDLDNSQMAVAEFWQAVDEQQKLIEHQHQDLTSHKSMLTSYETSLKAAAIELEKEKQQTTLATAMHENLKDQLKKESQEIEALQSAFSKEKALLQDSMQEVHSLKRELQQRDSSLSDTLLKLQLKETELVGAKLELQQVKSELSCVKLTLTQKDMDLQAAQRAVQELQMEVTQVRSLLQTKEDQLARVTLLLHEKEEEVTSLRLDLDNNHTQLSQATSIVNQLRELSQALVNSTGNQGIFENDSMLMQRNCELFVTNCALLETELRLERLQEQWLGDGAWRQELEAELEAVKETLQEKGSQLLEAQHLLATKDQELKQLVDCLDAHETELVKMREKVKEKPEILTRLHMATHLREHFGDSALEQMQLQVAKMEVDGSSSMGALHSLEGLNRGLLEECSSADLSLTSSSSASFTLSASSEFHKPLVVHADIEEDEDVEDLQSRLRERDAALEVTRDAMENLTKLIKRLISGVGLDGLGFSAIATTAKV
jgi:chromosome segregation ATPase